MEAGNRTLCIASLNPDTFINPDQRLTIANMLILRKIHIAAIQETHIPHDLDYTLNGYRIITSAIKQIPEQTNPQTGLHIGGVAILIHEDLTHHITSIVRTNHRIMAATLQSQNTPTPVTIINKYAPHKGLRKQEK